MFKRKQNTKKKIHAATFKDDLIDGKGRWSLLQIATIGGGQGKDLETRKDTAQDPQHGFGGLIWGDRMSLG